MAELKEARVPDIGGHGDVPVIELLVKPGDTVTRDQGLITLESDKATMEVPSPFAGILRELKVQLGDTVSEGALVAVIEVADAAATPAAQAAPAAPAPVQRSIPTYTIPPELFKPRPTAEGVTLKRSPPVPISRTVADPIRTTMVRARPTRPAPLVPALRPGQTLSPDSPFDAELLSYLARLPSR